MNLINLGYKTGDVYYNEGVGADALSLSNITSSPILGNSGVFVIRKIKDSAPDEPSGLVSLKSSISSQAKAAKDFKLVNALREKSTIKDNRSTFY